MQIGRAVAAHTDAAGGQPGRPATTPSPQPRELLPGRNPHAPGARHQLMREQFYTNNDRSGGQPGLAQENLAPPGRHMIGGPPPWTGLPAGYRFDLSGSRAPPTSDHQGQPNESQPLLAPAGNSSELGDAIATFTSVVSATSQLPKECLQQYNPAFHSASPSMPSGIMGAELQAAAATAPTSEHGNYSSASGASADCGDQFALMNIRTEELNFADTEQVWLVKGWPEILARVSCVAPIVLLGLLGNLTIIYSMCRFKPIRSKPTNIFILNMAIADLLTTIVCPNAALFADIHQFYVMGAVVCRTEGFIKITCLLVSAYSLIVLSFDWFLSVVRPCRRRITIRQSWLTLAGIWLVSVSMASPLLHWRRLRERHWRDITEVWCCELIQYTKYYWVCMTLFLIYLPTFVMTIVLVVILAQMDRFEAKLRRSRGPQKGAASTTAPPTAMTTTSAASEAPPSLAGPISSLGGPSSGVAATNTSQNNNNNTSLPPSNSTRISTSTASPAANSTRTERHLSSSLSLGMKYRRRIVKILFFYLLTSIVCWTPLQFTIIYRHFRSEAVPAGWFFELTFYSQLSASLSAAMNPVIFGFLSQPFRRVVTKSWMFRFLDKVWRTRSDAGGGGGGEQHAMNYRQGAVAPAHQLAGPAHRNGAQLQAPKLTLEYVEHRRHQHAQQHGRRPHAFSRQSLDVESARAPPDSRAPGQRPPGANYAPSGGARGQHNQRAHRPRHLPTKVRRSRSSSNQPAAVGSAHAPRHKRVSFNSKSSANSNNGGLENAAYLRGGDEDDGGGGNGNNNDHDKAGPKRARATADKTTSFIVAARSSFSGREQETKKQNCDSRV